MHIDNLKHVFRQRNITMSQLIEELNKEGIKMSPRSLYRKLDGETEFTRSEIKALKDVLNLSQDETDEIFFA